MIDRDKVRRILRDYPTLTKFGFGLECDDPFDGHDLAACLEFMSLCGPIKSPNKCSYHVKHLVEAWLHKSQEPSGCYIGGGVPILAAMYLGFKWKKPTWGPNADIALSAKCEKWEQLPPYAGTWLVK